MPRPTARPVALALALSLALAAPPLAARSQPAAAPAWLAVFRDHCIPFVQGRTLRVAEALARKAGHGVTAEEQRLELQTAAGPVSIRQYPDGRRFCEVRPAGADYPALQRDLGAWLPTAPDGPFARTHGPGPDIEGQRAVVWKGPRYRIQINEEHYDDRDGTYLFVEAATAP